MNEHEHDIQCANCGKWFDLIKAEVGLRILPNTFTDLPDIGEPWCKCPHCGFVTERNGE